MGLIDLIFPKKCVVCKKNGSYLCENCFAFLSFDPKSLCLLCNNPTLLLEAAKILKKSGAQKVFGLTLARD
jgi:predicted amidophosphoribosyltransferase